MPPLIIDAANAFRAALLQREAAQMAEAARRWIGVEQSLQAAVDALAYEMAQSDIISMGQLARSARYQALRRQIAEELAKYSDFAEGRIRSGQADMITDALTHSARMINAVSAEAQIVAPFNRISVGAVNNMIGFAGDGSPLRAVLDDATRGAGDALGQSLISGTALGKNPVEVARQAIRLGLGQSFTRIQAIARTEMLRTYRQTSLSNYEASNVVVAYRRLSARDSRVCPACLFADGRTYPVGYGFDAHVNCIVGGTVVSSPHVLATSKRWFDGEVIEIRTVNGNVLTVTENHPVLTDQGWVAAHLLKEGDNVISSLDSERTISLVDPNDYSRPTVIEDILESFARTGGMAPVSVPTSPVDFHGDGMHGNVDIVRASGFLEDGRQATVGQPLSEQSFIGSSVGQGFLLADSAIAELLECSLSPTCGDMHGSGKSFDFFRSALAHHQAVGFGLSADSDTGINQPVTHDVSNSVVFSSERIFGDTRQVEVNKFGHRKIYPLISTGFPCLAQRELPAFGVATHDAASTQFGSESLFCRVPPFGGSFATVAGNVVTDRILEVSRRVFSGHVYNLQTSTGWYIAEGIITHNCRCTLVPVLRSVPPVQFQDGQTWFRQQPAATQRQILGAGRYQAWQDGRASLDDMVSRSWSDDWGGSLHPTRVRDLGPR